MGADSLDVIETVIAIEKVFDIDIPDEDIEKFRIINDMVAYVEYRIKTPVKEVFNDTENKF
ncbi:MAG: phosphopantetheine-binding protein [Candidatus Omnitrophota bacterium]